VIRGLRFRRLTSKNRFAEALAVAAVSELPSYDTTLYACYRLGMYETVANSAHPVTHWRDGIARAASLAACGRVAEAGSLAESLLAEHKSVPHRLALIIALTPFAPHLALRFLDPVQTPVGLHAALLMRSGDAERGMQLLQTAMTEGPTAHGADLHLLLSNATSRTPEQQLMRMNAFLARYALPEVALRDENVSPGTLNLTVGKPLPGVQGPMVSVLMTAYQAAGRIGAAIASLLAQTYRNLEIIVIDDASTDHTEQVVRAIAEHDPRVRYLQLPRNVGTYVAKNIGLQMARGEFATCHDSDDWSHPLKIERQVRPLLADCKLVFTTSYWVRMQDDGIFYARQVYPLLRLNPASPLFRIKAVREQAGGWDGVRTGADSEFSARLALVFGKNARHRVLEPLTFGAHRADSLMTASATGYSEAGLSPTRLRYWEQWSQYHIACLREDKKPFMPTNLLADRQFLAPAEIMVPPGDIKTCLDHLRLAT